MVGTFRVSPSMAAPPRMLDALDLWWAVWRSARWDSMDAASAVRKREAVPVVATGVEMEVPVVPMEDKLVDRMAEAMEGPLEVHLAEAQEAGLVVDRVEAKAEMREGQPAVHPEEVQEVAAVAELVVMPAVELVEEIMVLEQEQEVIELLHV